MAKKKRRRRQEEPAAEAESVGGVQVSGIRSMESFDFVKPGGKVPTVYGPVIAQMQKLQKRGDAFEVFPPPDTLPKVFSNRLTSLLQRHPVDPPRGLRFSKRLTRRGTVAIFLADASTTDK